MTEIDAYARTELYAATLDEALAKAREQFAPLFGDTPWAITHVACHAIVVATGDQRGWEVVVEARPELSAKTEVGAEADLEVTERWPGEASA